MYWIIGGDNKEYGPVTADQLQRWIAEGRLNAQSLIRAEAGTEWKPLSLFPEFDQVLRAKLAPPPPAPNTAMHPIDSQNFTAAILSRVAQLDIGACMSRSWNLLSDNFGVLVGSVLLVWLFGIICQVIPLIGPLASLVFGGVLYGGLYLVFIRRIRGEPASIADVFAGFSIMFAQLLLAGLVTKVLVFLAAICCLILPGLYLLVAWIFALPLVADKRLEFWSAMELSRKMVNRVFLQIVALLVIVWLPSILFRLFIGIKTGLSIFPQIQDILASGHPDPTRLMHWGMSLARENFVWGVVSKFILLLNMPWAVGALMYAYEDLFGTRPSSPA
jgi:hypothetical protein